MDFKRVLQIVAGEFSNRDIRFGLIGGFGMAALGVARTTMDMDFLLHRDDLPEARKVLEAAGFQLVFESENVAQFVGDVRPKGTLDFILAFRPIAVGMLARAKRLRVFAGTLLIPVLIPDDIIGLKVQAMANDPKRREQDTADIVALLDEFGSEVDWHRVESYFELFNLNSIFESIRRRCQ